MPWQDGQFVPYGDYVPSYASLPRNVTSAISGGAPNVGDRIGYYDRKGKYLGPLYDASGNKLKMPKGATGIRGSMSAQPDLGEGVGRQFTLPAVLARQNPAAEQFQRPAPDIARSIGYSGGDLPATTAFNRFYNIGYGAGREAEGVQLPPPPTFGSQIGDALGSGVRSIYNRFFGQSSGPIAMAPPFVPPPPRYASSHAQRNAMIRARGNPRAMRAAGAMGPTFYSRSALDYYQQHQPPNYFGQ